MQYIAILVVAVVLIVAASAQDKYTTKFDNIDLDQILKNDRLLQSYTNCLLNKGTCTPDGAELKKVVPDALKTECSKCSDMQKAGSRKVLVHLIENKKEIYDELEKLYDPTGDYKKKYCEVAKEEGLAVSTC